jgi:hypothetical protein
VEKITRTKNKNAAVGEDILVYHDRMTPMLFSIIELGNGMLPQVFSIIELTDRMLP